MNDDFFKFPQTPHLCTLAGVEIRDDKVLSPSERDEFLKHELTIEEKVDGANLGISFDDWGNIRAQNRGAFLQLPASGQWKKLEEWLEARSDMLFEHLSDRFILFGEWCYARHSIFYDLLPDWFLAFDIYDKKANRFLSSTRRNVLLKKMQVAEVPKIAQGHFSLAELNSFLTNSKLATNKPAEGIYLRFDKGEWLEQRTKLVRPEFIQAVEEHWSKHPLIPNRLSIPRHG